MDFFFELRICLDLALAAESVYIEIMFESVCFWIFEIYVRAPGILGVDFILCSQDFSNFPIFENLNVVSRGVVGLASAIIDTVSQITHPS